MKWVEKECNNVRMFQLMDFPKVFYVIKLRDGYYMLVHDDAHEIGTGKVEILKEDGVKSKYGVNLNNG
jgi:hypothetical protein